MEITPKKIDFSKINEVKSGDGITTQHINAPLQASAYAQALATNKPSFIETEGGEPNVSIQEKADGTPYLVFENIGGGGGGITEEDKAEIVEELKDYIDSEILGGEW